MPEPTAGRARAAGGRRAPGRRGLAGRRAGPAGACAVAVPRGAAGRVRRVTRARAGARPWARACGARPPVGSRSRGEVGPAAVFTRFPRVAAPTLCGGRRAGPAEPRGHGRRSRPDGGASGPGRGAHRIAGIEPGAESGAGAAGPRTPTRRANARSPVKVAGVSAAVSAPRRRRAGPAERARFALGVLQTAGVRGAFTERRRPGFAAGRAPGTAERDRHAQRGVCPALRGSPEEPRAPMRVRPGPVCRARGSLPPPLLEHAAGPCPTHARGPNSRGTPKTRTGGQRGSPGHCLRRPMVGPTVR
ncbi:collagen alpha-2(I) chain-like [Mustela erminea]|uniref:collagen alpha-2(I) chain-like n=1 Tax=Mustela erminea TaxID=36723 RepID=UPI00138663F2|nr:collagen alpha-2(I) chain-like [Mustela erminea]